MTAELLCMGEPMLEFNQLPLRPDGARHYLEGHGGDTSNAAVAAARQGASVGMITGLGRDMPGDSFMALWTREGIDTSTRDAVDRYLTGVYFVTHDQAGHHFLHYRANSAAAMFGPEDVPVRAIGHARMLYLPASQGISTTACDATLAAMFCSDGINEGLYEHQIVEVLRVTKAGFNPAKVLVESAVKSDGRDNATAVVVRMT